MAKKRKVMRKSSNNTKTDEKTSNGLKVYKVNGTERKEDKKARKEKTVQTFLIVLIIVLALAAIFSAIKTFAPDLFGSASLSGKLAARVNSAPITLLQLDQDYDRLPLQYKYFVTKEQFLSQLIDETLMVQEAMARGVTVTDEEIDQSIAGFMQDSNVTQEKLDEILKEKNLKYEEFRTLIRNQLLIDKLVQEEINGDIEITSEQALQYYNENPDTFKIPELATARHILVATANRTEEDAEQRAEMILKLVKNDTTRFCSYVTLYTDDGGSIESCGQYTFPRGQMVEEFENKSFEQKIGEMSVVKTDFGFHVIQTINKTSEELISFKDVQEQIYVILQNQQEKILYSNFIVSLREKAEIINYLEPEKEEVVGEPAEESVSEGEIEIVIEEPEAEEGAITTVNVTVPEEEEMEELEEIAEEQEELEEEVEEVVEEVVEEEINETVEEVVEEEPEEVVEEEPVEEVSLEDMTFTQCLTYQGATLYGAYWDSSTKKQKDYFGIDIADINYVECGVEADYRAQQLVCKEAGILAYPTWVINGKMHMGILSLDQLSSMSGCER